MPRQKNKKTVVKQEQEEIIQPKRQPIELKKEAQSVINELWDDHTNRLYRLTPEEYQHTLDDLDNDRLQFECTQFGLSPKETKTANIAILVQEFKRRKNNSNTLFRQVNPFKDKKIDPDVLKFLQEGF